LTLIFILYLLIDQDPFTHIYMYDLGFPPPLQQSIALKFNNSVHAQYLVSYRPPHRVINEYKYDVELVDRVATSMHGSGEGHTAYFYKRTNIAREANDDDLKVMIPGRESYGEEDVHVVCDPLFSDAVRLAVGDKTELHRIVQGQSTEAMGSGRPQRTRQPPKAYP
jgi:hypothetical protein